MHKINTVIIGGGISGLSAGHFLNKKGVNFILLESDNKIGGVIKTVNKNGFIFENGPNTILNNNSSIDKLINDHKLQNNIIYPNLKSNSKRFLFFKDNPVAVPNNFWDFIKTPLLSIVSKIRIFKEFFLKPHLNNTSVYNFISRRFGKQFHDNLIEPFLTGIYAGDTRKMSAKHSLKRLWDLEQTYGSVIKGVIKSNKQNIKSINFSNGISEIVNQLEKRLYNKIKVNQKVTKIKKTKSGYEIFIKEKKSFVCKNIISAIPAFELAKIIFDDDLKLKLNDLKYNPIDVFHFVFKKEDVKIDLNGFGILTKPSDKKSFLGILFNNKIFPHLCPKEYNLYTVMVGGEKQKDILKLSNIELKAKILNELREIIECKGKIYKTNYYSWKKGIPQYNKSQEEIEQAIFNFQQSNNSFRVIGNYYSGVSVSDCVQKAELAALEIF